MVKDEMCHEHSLKLAALDIKIDSMIDNQNKQYNKLLNALLNDNKYKNKTMDMIITWTFRLIMTAGIVALGIKNFVI